MVSAAHGHISMCGQRQTYPPGWASCSRAVQKEKRAIQNASVMTPTLQSFRRSNLASVTIHCPLRAVGYLVGLHAARRARAGPVALHNYCAALGWKCIGLYATWSVMQVRSACDSQRRLETSPLVCVCCSRIQATRRPAADSSSLPRSSAYSGCRVQHEWSNGL